MTDDSQCDEAEAAMHPPSSVSRDRPGAARSGSPMRRTALSARPTVSGTQPLIPSISAGRRAVIWPLAGPFSSPDMAYWMVTRSEYLYIAILGANVRFCRRQSPAVLSFLTNHPAESRAERRFISQPAAAVATVAAAPSRLTGTPATRCTGCGGSSTAVPGTSGARKNGAQ